MTSKKLLRGSFATYRTREHGQVFNMTNLEELCKVLLNWGNLPRNLNNKKAMELSCLAEHWLYLWAKQKRKKK